MSRVSWRLWSCNAEASGIVQQAALLDGEPTGNRTNLFHGCSRRGHRDGRSNTLTRALVRRRIKACETWHKHGPMPELCPAQTGGWLIKVVKSVLTAVSTITTGGLTLRGRSHSASRHRPTADQYLTRRWQSFFMRGSGYRGLSSF